MQSKIVSLAEFSNLQQTTLAGKKVVFTNGCFDILHPGHTDYLARAKALGDILVLGLNADESISRLKGSKRPIQNLKARALVLSALASVDYIISFEDDTPLYLIETIKPSVLVKGGDYTEDMIVGAKEVKASGGKIEIIPFLEGYSTSKIEEKIRAAK